jgi:hypothetical protein
VVLLIRRTMRPRGYAFESSLAAALLADFLSILREWFPVVPRVQIVEAVA